jgi:FkbM family methyltransferase
VSCVAGVESFIERFESGTLHNSKHERFPLKTISVTIFGQAVECPDLPEYRKFYRKLEAGAWEPHTFLALRENLDKATTYVDIGGFTGVVAFWASRLAKRVVIVEPDPKCREILAQLAPVYPNVTVLEGALSPLPTLRLNSVSGFGSSETSALDIGDGTSIVAQGLSVDDIMRCAGPDPAFVKIDIEGYEYVIADEIATLQSYPVRGVQCALHPALYERSLAGSRLRRRLKTTLVTLKLGRMFAGTFDGPSMPGFSSFSAYVWWGVLLAKLPKGKDLLFLRKARDHSRMPVRSG